MMKYLVLVSRLLVGGLLILTGLIKANDVVGFAYRIDDCLSASGLEFLRSTSSLQAGMICFLELIVGAMLLVGRKVKLVTALVVLIFLLYLIFGMISTKETVANEFRYVSSSVSISKDFILLLLGLFLYLKSKQIKPWLSDKVTKVVLTTFVLFSAAIPIYSYNFLPIIDNGAYSVRTDLALKNEQQFKAFEIFDMQGGIVTAEVFKNKEHQLFMVIEDIATCNFKSLIKCNELAAQAEKSGIPFYGLASNEASMIEDFRHEVQAAYPFLKADQQVLRSMIRSNPGLILLKGSTIEAKWHYNSIPNFVELNAAFKLKSGGQFLIQ